MSSELPNLDKRSRLIITEESLLESPPATHAVAPAAVMPPAPPPPVAPPPSRTTPPAPPPAPPEVPTVFCQACGTQLDARAVVCPRCGVAPRGAAPMAGLASVGARLGAACIDGAIIVAAWLLLSVVIDAAPLLISLLAWAVWLLYAPLMLARHGEHNGQTLGKQLVNVRVVQPPAPELSFGQACLREIVGRFLPNLFTLGIYSIVDSVWCLVDDNRQTLHDKIASTYVVRADLHSSR